MNVKRPQQTEFKVVLEGVDLDPEVETRLRQAIQTVVLNEVAGMDFHGDERAPMFVLLGDGHTQGIWARIADMEVIQRTFPGIQ